MEDSELYYTSYEIPDDESILWRYMDLAKFISLLKDRALYMTRADRFEDPFEGAVGLLRNKKEYDESFIKFYYEILGDKVEEGSPSNDPKMLTDNIHWANDLLRRNSFVNCWNENRAESVAMWKLYAPASHAQGIAVKTNYARLKDAIDRDVEIGRIIYRDYALNPPEINDAIWTKRLSFEYEHEVRIRILPPNGLQENPPEFMMLPVDLEKLIESVYVSPMSKTWFLDVVRDVLRRYGINKLVFHSTLDDEALI